MAKWQRVRIPVDFNLNSMARRVLAEDVIDFIVNRTQKKSLDKKNIKFPKYTKTYRESELFKAGGKTSKVNLTLTNEMLDELKVISDCRGSILIGYDKNDKELNGKVKGNILGTYGQKTPIFGKKRDFLGITRKDLKILEQKVKKRIGVEADIKAMTAAVLKELELKKTTTYKTKAESDNGDNS